MESNSSQSKRMRCNSNKLQLWKLMLDMKKKKIMQWLQLSTATGTQSACGISISGNFHKSGG